jgi:hypothetical protein
MRRVHPERILLAVVAPLVIGGGILSAIGAMTRNHGLLKFGFGILLVGGAISCLPLLAALIYFTWQKVSKFLARKHTDA